MNCNENAGNADDDNDDNDNDSNNNNTNTVISSHNTNHEKHTTGLGLTHWGWDKMDAICQTTFSNEYSGMKMCEFW